MESEVGGGRSSCVVRIAWIEGVRNREQIDVTECHDGQKRIGIMSYCAVPFGRLLEPASISIVSSKSFADGTAADVAAPAAARSCCGGATSLWNGHYNSVDDNCLRQNTRTI